ncbi:hypothetical protein GCM10018779_31840 [Streptomyces griseocarneus]|nr:hypothetical protein GCM10018779_31840 [Streptomyces griseocarneus]
MAELPPRCGAVRPVGDVLGTFGVFGVFGFLLRSALMLSCQGVVRRVGRCGWLRQAAVDIPHL